MLELLRAVKWFMRGTEGHDMWRDEMRGGGGTQVPTC